MIETKRKLNSLEMAATESIASNQENLAVENSRSKPTKLSNKPDWSLTGFVAWFSTPKAWWLAAFASTSWLVIAHVLEFSLQAKFWFLPFTIPISALICRKSWNRVVRYPTTKVSTILVILAVPTLWCGVVFWLPWLGALALVLLFAAFCCCHLDFEGNQLSIYLLPSLLFLPIPKSLGMAVENALVGLLGYVTGAFFDYLEIPHRIVNGVCDYAHGLIILKDVTEGLNSLSCALFLASLIFVTQRKSVWLFPVYMVAAFLSVAISNLLQLFVVVKLDRSEWLTDSYLLAYVMLGSVSLVGTCTLLLSFDRLISIVFHPVEDQSLGKLIYNPLIKIWDYAFSQRTTEKSYGQRLLLAATLDRPTKVYSKLMGVVILFLAGALLIQTWLVARNVFKSSSWKIGSAIRPEDLGDFNPPGWNLVEFGNSVALSPPSFGDGCFNWSFQHKNNKLQRLTMAITAAEGSWLEKSSRLGWVERGTTSTAAPTTQRSAEVQVVQLRKDGSDVTVFSQYLPACKRDVGLFNPANDSWLANVFGELTISKRFATSDGIMV